ncbi:MAG: hypothetical protein FJ265_18815 [Planctomycetes bacterium]|nr:hypothetical protein [Planctomycetota bacterium]
MRFVLCASLGLAVSLSAQVQDQGSSPEFQTKSAYAEFVRTHAGPWVVRWNPATLTPEAIYGQGLPIANWTANTLEAARGHANAALATYRDVLGLGTSEFRESIGARMGRTWSFTYDQYFRGVPVVHGRADVRINMAGRVAMLGSVAFPIPADFDTTPAIGEQLATALAWRALGADPTGVAQPGLPRGLRLVIWGDVTATDLAPFALAWEVPVSNVDRNGQGPIGRYYVDAKSGAVLHFQNDKHECGFASCTNPVHEAATPVRAPLAAPVLTTVTLMAWTRTGIDAYSALVNVPLRGIVLSVPGVGTVTTDQNGQFTIDIAAPVTITVGQLDGTHHAVLTGADAPSGNFVVDPGVNSTIQLLTAAATTNQAAHPTCAYWIDATNVWCRSILGNSTQLATASNITPRVNIASTCNAYYTNNTINFYNAGGGCANTAFSTVISHEWGHGLDDRYGGISNSTGDGLSEGWSDIIGMYIVDSPMLGSGFQTAGVALRRGDNTLLYPQTGAPVHTAGQTWMGFAWRYRENLRAAFGTAQAIAISDDTVIGSIVANAWNQPAAVEQVFIADDDDGNLANGTPHYAQLSAAAIAKNLPYPELQVASISHTPLASTSTRLTPRLVNATVAPVSSGTITQVRLVYNTGTGNQTRVMIPNGATNGYRGMLPGIVSGSVSYHLEATHSSNLTVRLPATGEYTYVVSVPPTGPFVGFYSETFESGAAGWTHARQSGTSTDDWQLGAPNGKSGTSSGVTWADPSAAVTTGSVYGTDLGAGTSNGAYPANMNYYLRSPVINCTGRTGVTLRFKRWLTVEEGIYDRATVSVNGVQIWVNASSGHHRDTAWTTVEYPIPAADNNPSVQIEFRLVTDAGLQLGGWNVDNLELGTRYTPPLDAELRMTPDQVAQGNLVNIEVATQGGPRLFYLAIGDAAGPTLFPGVPPILVGNIFYALPAFTDTNGLYGVAFLAPAPASALGILWYSQVLTLDATNTTILTSNQWLNLFTQ